mmetsp:Transcript_1789/g.2341  ORF Transcript_1789/g.2341 Transcript_1789/m.2341 type:complete len:85 (+) Transcript_1789:348-602(+)
MEQVRIMNMSKFSTGRKGKGIDDKEKEEEEKIISNLINDMDDALKADIASNSEKKMAIKRLLLLNRIDRELRKQSAQETFIEKR